MNAKLKAQFALAKKTQRAVALAIGIQEQRISDFINGVRKPNLEEMEKIAAELGCEVEEIF